MAQITKDEAVKAAKELLTEEQWEALQDRLELVIFDRYDGEMVICRRCGTSVLRKYKERHADWHYVVGLNVGLLGFGIEDVSRRLGELAQGVSDFADVSLGRPTGVAKMQIVNGDGKVLFELEGHR